MKSLNQYINEFLIKGHTKEKQEYKYFPKTKEELQSIIKRRINKEGVECDLNDIDTSAITEMDFLFSNHLDFNGDISKWDTSNVVDMTCMFYGCVHFNCDISSWDVSKVEYMTSMFSSCHKFNQDLSSWDVSKVYNTEGMFENCTDFNQDLSKWDLSNVEDLDMDSMFKGCKSLKNIPSWYVTIN